MILGIVEWLTKATDALREFMLNSKHPVILYTGLFILGLIVFASVYGALHNKR